MNHPHLQPKPRAGTRRFPGAVPFGYSLTEMIMVVALLGILATIGIPQISNTNYSTRLAVAREKCEMLNRGVNGYTQSFRDTGMTPSAGGGDEQTVLLTLQYRDPNNPLVGAPFVQPRYRPQISSSAQDFRLQWAGSGYRVLEPGTAGTGFRVPWDGSDMGTPFVYPPNFRSLGR